MENCALRPPCTLPPCRRRGDKAQPAGNRSRQQLLSTELAGRFLSERSILLASSTARPPYTGEKCVHPPALSSAKICCGVLLPRPSVAMCDPPLVL